MRKNPPRYMGKKGKRGRGGEWNFALMNRKKIVGKRM
jgi:hypothetical protein